MTTHRQVVVKTEPKSEKETWDDSTDLVYPPAGSSNRRVRLLQQVPLVQDVARKSINFFEISILTVDAFPNGIAKATFLNSALFKGAEVCGTPDILARLKEDRRYRTELASIVRRMLFILYTAYSLSTARQQDW